MKSILMISLICLALHSVQAQRHIAEEFDTIDKLISFRDYLMKQDISFKHELLSSIDHILIKKIDGLRQKRKKNSIFNQKDVFSIT